MTLDTTSRTLPPAVDLRPNVFEVEDQGPIGSCLANTGAGMIECMLERLHQYYPDYAPDPAPEISRLYLYYWMRNYEARLKEEGAFLPSLFDVLMTKGVCMESTWPYDVAKYNQQPPTECDVEAKEYRVLKYASLMPATFAWWERDHAKTLNNIKHALAQGRPVVLGMQLSKDFIAVGKNCKNWLEFDWNINTESAGGHAVLCIGYDDAAKRFLIQNSWGPAWGDGGFFGIPYVYFAKWEVVHGAFCSLQDNFGGPVRVPDYKPRVWDETRLSIIRQVVNAQMQPVATAASTFAIPSEEIDVAMRWPIGTFEVIKDQVK